MLALWERALPGTSETLRLIELTSARLRHGIDDRVGAWPEAAVEPGGDLSSATPSGGSASKAPSDLAWRAKLLHAAWDADSDALSAACLPFLATGLPADVTVDPSGLGTTCVFPPSTGRIVLNLLLLAADSLPSGGTVMLAGSADDLFLQIVGLDAAWPAGMAACAVDEAAAVATMTDVEVSAPADVQMPLTTLLAHASGVRLSFLMSPATQAAPPMLRLGGG